MAAGLPVIIPFFASIPVVGKAQRNDYVPLSPSHASVCVFLLQSTIMRLRYLWKYSARLWILKALNVGLVCDNGTGQIDWRLLGTEKVSLGRRVGSKAS